MCVKGLFSRECTTFNLKASKKMEIIDELIELLAKENKINDKIAFKKAVLAREEEFSTGVGMGVAIPHAKGTMVNEAAIAFCKSSEPIDFEAIDGEPAQFFFMIAVPSIKSEIHLKAIAEICRKLINKDVRDQLIKTDNYDEFLNIW